MAMRPKSGLFSMARTSVARHGRVPHAGADDQQIAAFQRLVGQGHANGPRSPIMSPTFRLCMAVVTLPTFLT